jgi:hypothetical protein
MLKPDQRRLYTDALRPPPGFRFGEAVAATYSLSLDTLLTIPLHLALFSTEQPVDELLRDGAALLEALRRTTDRVTVYGQGGAIPVPTRTHVLYSMLEPSVVSVAAPAEGGLFHPKVWFIRFDGPTDGASRLRLLVLTRNITDDRCWDLVLSLDGVPGAEPRQENRPLHEFIRRLPELGYGPMPHRRVEQAHALADLLLRTRWEPPEPFDDVGFHVLGLGGTSGWLPRQSDCLAVISPFLSAEAIEALAESTAQPHVLVSRPEQAALVNPKSLNRFGRVMVLAEQAELEDGEEAPIAPTREFPSHGLHAKAYIADVGHTTHVYVGSANATWPALIGGRNVELVAELVGQRSRVGGVEKLLGPDAFGAVLADYIPPTESERTDPAIVQAQEALERARRVVAAAGLRVRFTAGPEAWSAMLVPAEPMRLGGVASIRAWFVTRKPETALDVSRILDGHVTDLGSCLAQHATSFVAFALTALGADETVRFVLPLEAEGLPKAERDAAIVRDVIRNQEGFLRYVMLILAEVGEGGDVFGGGGGLREGMARPVGESDELPLFEHMTRAFCRQPDRLESVRRLLGEIGADHEGEVVPPAFARLWEVFRQALAQGRDVNA